MYSPKYNLIFIHNKKVAGTSFKRAISSQDPYIQIRRFDNGLLDDTFRAFVKDKRPMLVTITRNPWDRFMSAWKWGVSTRYRSVERVLRFPPGENLIASALSAKDARSKMWFFLEYLHREHLARNALFMRLFNKPETWWGQEHDFEHFTRQQTERFLDPNGELIVNRLNFETLGLDSNSLLSELGINIKLEHENVSAREKNDYRKVLQGGNLDLFNNLFYDDVAKLGYSYELGPGHPPTQ